MNNLRRRCKTIKQRWFAIDGTSIYQGLSFSFSNNPKTGIAFSSNGTASPRVKITGSFTGTPVIEYTDGSIEKVGSKRTVNVTTPVSIEFVCYLDEYLSYKREFNTYSSFTPTHHLCVTIDGESYVICYVGARLKAIVNTQISAYSSPATYTDAVLPNFYIRFLNLTSSSKLTAMAGSYKIHNTIQKTQANVYNVTVTFDSVERF